MIPILEEDDLDNSEDNADWIKQAWDLPPYRSAEFFQVIPLDMLNTFKQSMAYRSAVAKGLIHDDEWVGDYVKDTMKGFADELVDTINSGKVEKVAVDRAAHEAATSIRNDLDEPSDAQKEAGNYKMGHLNVGGIDITIENPIGSRRRPNWETLKAHYGYIKLTEGADGDQIDVFVREGTDGWTGPVYVVDQIINGKFDEHKVLVGFFSRQEAVKAYLGSYQAGWQLGPVTRWSWKRFKAWVDKRRHSQPVSQG
jgi:hypothetical protein